MNPFQAEAGPSRRVISKSPFVSADHRPPGNDGKFRVIIVSTGSVASVKIPDIVGALSRIPEIEIQIVATRASLHFYDQARVNDAVWGSAQMESAILLDGREQTTAERIRIWRDEDEWSDWNKLGDPILHIELRRWADLVVIAPCSADFLAKLAAGFSDNLALSMMRALTTSTPVIVCPAMNTHMYQHTFTADHLKIIQERLGYMVSGPQGAGKLACGDEGAGKMTDWRDIVSMIENYGAMFVKNQKSANQPFSIRPSQSSNQQSDSALPVQRPPQTSSATPSHADPVHRPPTPPTPGRAATDTPHGLSQLLDITIAYIKGPATTA